MFEQAEVVCSKWYRSQVAAICMLWSLTATLAMMSGLWVSFAHGQQTGQTAVPQSTNSKDSEISSQTTDEAIKVMVNLVLVPVVVKDADGRVVPDLKQEDFRIWDNGKQQRVPFAIPAGEGCSIFPSMRNTPSNASGGKGTI